jgi:solute carrier family 25 oxoglutarate transporter 11
MSNDYSLPVEKRRNYRNVFDAFYRIVKEEGPSGFFRGVAPFVNRAMIVGAVQIGTYDHFREYYRKEKGVTNPVLNVFYSAMTSGLIYSFVTMPFEAAKNRMAFQKPDPATGKLQYDGMLSTWRFIVRNEGVLQLWAGYLPYYLRCGMHTLFMFMSIELLRKLYKKVN